MMEKKTKWCRMRKNPKGFTFIELCVAIVIFAVGITGIIKMQMASVASNNFSMQMTDALNTAQRRIETLSNLTTSHDSLSVGSHSAPGIVSRGITYSSSWQVTDPGVGDAVQVVLTVAWKDKAADHSISIPFITR